MGDPRAKLNAAIPGKFIEAHPIETAAKQDSDDAGKQAEKLRAGQEEVVFRAPAREQTNRNPQRRCNGDGSKHERIANGVAEAHDDVALFN
jgi:hypothetical protein